MSRAARAIRLRSSHASSHAGWVAVFAVAAGLAIFTWNLLWFLCDDAYIAFRYASNLVAGRGLVWNPAPFHPVEGYTSFAWVVLLSAVWKLTGLLPPDTANWISLFFGLVTLGVGASILARMPLPPSFERHRKGLAVLALLATAGNPTFATFLSSGLETSLFSAAITSWLALALRAPPQRPGRWLAGLSALAAVCALTRPGGALTCVATVAIAGVQWLLSGRPPPGLHLAGLAPLLAVPIHLAWRLATYGDWVPNTYYAKHVAAWPASGWRYVASFAVEYALWLWAALVGAAALRGLRRARELPALLRRHYPGLLALSVLLFHFAYYTFDVGGDHFEYRIYHHWILWIFVSAAFAVTRLTRSAVLAYLLLAGLIAASLPIGWLQWQVLHTTAWNRVRRAVVVSRHVPAWAHPVTRRYDGWQRWLNTRGVCRRQAVHQKFMLRQLKRFPPRVVGEKLTWEKRRAVLARGSVGYVGWTLPNVAIIDKKGLNDRIIARHRTIRLRRHMAHDRDPPPGYVDCFLPNVRVTGTTAKALMRPAPLSDERIRSCERRFERAR